MADGGAVFAPSSFEHSHYTDGVTVPKHTALDPRKRLRPPWRSPVGAIALAALAVVLGVIGFDRVTSVPEEKITFEIEEGLPYGITAESVEHVIESRNLRVFEPFTFRVTERDLEWSETYRGETGDADIIFSVGDDPEDRDLVIEDFTRVAFNG